MPDAGAEDAGAEDAGAEDAGTPPSCVPVSARPLTQRGERGLSQVHASDRTHTYVAWRTTNLGSQASQDYVTRVAHDGSGQREPVTIPFTPREMVIIEGSLYALYGERTETRLARLDLEGNVLNDILVVDDKFVAGMVFDGNSIWMAVSMDGNAGVSDIYLLQVSLRGELVGSPIRVTDSSGYVTGGSLTFNGTSFAIGYGYGVDQQSQWPYFLSFTLTGTVAHDVLPPRRLSPTLVGQASLLAGTNGYLVSWGYGRTPHYARLSLDGQFDFFPRNESAMALAKPARGSAEYVLVVQTTTDSIGLLTVPDIGSRAERESFTVGDGPHHGPQIQWDGEGYTATWTRGEHRGELNTYQVMFRRLCL